MFPTFSAPFSWASDANLSQSDIRGLSMSARIAARAASHCTARKSRGDWHLGGERTNSIAWKEYGVSSPTAEVLYDVNYRIAEHPIQMGPGVDVLLPEQDPPPLREIRRLWDACFLQLSEEQQTGANKGEISAMWIRLQRPAILSVWRSKRAS